VVGVEKEQERIVRDLLAVGIWTGKGLTVQEHAMDLAKSSPRFSSTISMPSGVNHAISDTPSPWMGLP